LYFRRGAPASGQAKEIESTSTSKTKSKRHPLKSRPKIAWRDE
jgi:hypothetical protein